MTISVINLQEHKTGQKWSTTAALNKAQARMDHQHIVSDVRGASGVETKSANLRADWVLFSLHQSLTQMVRKTIGSSLQRSWRRNN